MNLPLELVHKIIVYCLERDVRSSQDILVWTKPMATLELLFLNRGIYNFIVQHKEFNKLRLWKLLCKIPRQYKAIQLATGISDHSWTILDIEVRNERVGSNKYENFLVLEEATRVYSEPKKWEKNFLYLEQHIKKRRIFIEEDNKNIPFFELYGFLNDLNQFATNNLMSIWLWKRSNTFFKKDILFNMTNNNNGSFRPILETQQKALLAWDRPLLNKHDSVLGLTETVMLYNTELFGRLL